MYFYTVKTKITRAECRHNKVPTSQTIHFEALLYHGVSMNVQQVHTGRTPAMLCCERGLLKLARCILLHGEVNGPRVNSNVFNKC